MGINRMISFYWRLSSLPSNLVIESLQWGCMLHFFLSVLFVQTPTTGEILHYHTNMDAVTRDEECNCLIFTSIAPQTIIHDNEEWKRTLLFFVCFSHESVVPLACVPCEPA
jgi:hypothetical protein